jgi:hypothetical protein
LTGLQLVMTPARVRRRQAFTAGADRKSITLFLAPEAGLGPFYASHVILARVLSDAGHPVVMLSCNGLQPTCSLKSAMQIAPTPPGNTTNAACLRCRSNAFRVGADYGLPDILLEDVLDQSLRAEIDRVMMANAAAPWDAVYDGIDVGTCCLVETLRAKRKTSVTELIDEDVELVRGLLYASLAIYLAVKELGNRFDIKRIAYFGDYAYFLPPQIYAAQHAIPLTNVCHAYHRDTDRRYLNLWPTHAAVHQLGQVDRWENYQADTIDPKIVADITDGAIYRLYGHGGISTYSPNWSEHPGDLREELGLPPGGKVVVAYTNSTDELICHKQALRMLGTDYENAPNPFVGQIAWLRQLVDWVGSRSDLRLILRLHPRMAASTRYSNIASEYRDMMEALASLPANVAIVLPESPVSSYNLAEIADVALTAWSSIGLELARFGIPVVAAFQKIGPFPNSDFIRFEETAAGYFNAIEQALTRAPTFDSVIGAFRWTHFLHWTPLIDIADVVPTADYEDVPPFQTPRNSDTILQVMADGVDIIALNMSRLPKGAAAVAAERHAVRTAIEKFLLYFMTGRLDEGATGATVIEAGRENIVTMIDGGRTIRRQSPLATRLVRILEEA